MPDFSQNRTSSGGSRDSGLVCSAAPSSSAAPMCSIDDGHSAAMQATFGNAAMVSMMDPDGGMCLDPGASTAPAAAVSPAAPTTAASPPRVGIGALDAAHPATEVDDTQVAAIIDELVRDTGLEGREAIRSAWSAAIGLRNRHPQDLNLAAAEHFLYSCGETEGFGSALQMMVLTTGYEGIKGALDLFGQRDLLSTDGSSPTPASGGVYRWGMYGATQSCGDLE